jgi:hypothetical protein
MHRLLRDFSVVIGGAIRWDTLVQRPMSAARGALHALGAMPQCRSAFQANLGNVHEVLTAPGWPRPKTSAYIEVSF